MTDRFFTKRWHSVALVALVAMSLVAFGCGTKNESSSLTNPNPNPFKPVGTITGVLADSVTQAPIVGATVAIFNQSAVTGPQGQFTIYNVPANVPVDGPNIGPGPLATDGNSGGNSWDFYTVVLDLTQVNAQRKLAIPSVALYPNIAYDVVGVKYSSLGESKGNLINLSNHDTPVDGFVANMLPCVGKLDANLKLQVVNKSLAIVPGATVRLFTDDGSNNNFSGSEGHLVATATSDAEGFANFFNVEAFQDYKAKATLGTLASDKVHVTAPADNLTFTAGVQGPNSGQILKLASVDDQKPLAGTVPAGFSEIAPLAGTEVQFIFNEAMASNAWSKAVSDLFPPGLQNAITVDGVSKGAIAKKLVWNASMTVLSVIFDTGGSSKYTVTIPASANKDQLTDAAGNLFDGKTLTFFTSGGGAVSPPVIVSTGGANIGWNPMPNAYQYNVYSETVDDGTPRGFKLDSSTSITLATIGTGDFWNGQMPIFYKAMVRTVNTDKTESTDSNTLDIKAPPAKIKSATAGTQVTNPANVFNFGSDLLSNHGIPDNTVKVYQMTVNFDQQMDQVSVNLASNWSVAKGTGFVSGAKDGGTLVSITKAVYTPQAVKGPVTNPATDYPVKLTFAVANDNGSTWDASHTDFIFSGQNLAGTGMDNTAQKWSAAALVH